jgi:general secretion pathway protein K
MQVAMNHARRIKNKRSNERGMALMSTVWIALLLALLIGTISMSVRGSMAYLRNNADLMQARELAEAALELGLHELSRNSQTRQLPRHGEVLTHILPSGTIALSIQDEAGKIDLNRARITVLKSLFVAAGAKAGLDAFDAVNLAEAVAGGIAENGERRGDASTVLPSVASLAAMPGMTETMYRTLEPDITVYSGIGAVNPMTATEGALAALPGVNSTTIARIKALQLRGGTRPVFEEAEEFFSSQSGPVYTITGTGRLKNGVSATLRLVVATAGVGPTANTNAIRIVERR